MPMACGPRGAGALELRTHVLLVQFLHCVPVETQFLGNVLGRRRAAAPAHVIRKALSVERIVGQQRQSFALHRATLTALNPTNFEVEQNTKRSTGQISHLPPRAVVKAAMNRPASPAVRFFARRARVTIRACGSPKRPRTIAPARKPGNENASAKWRRLGVLGVAKSCQIYPHLNHASNPSK